jgi:ATP-binding cassette subfamily F protein 3
MPSIDALIGALKDYNGTLIFVSHDVHFIRAIAEETIQIQAGQVIHYPGDYDYYLRKSGTSSDQEGLIAGLKNARPDGSPVSQGEHKAVSAKERRRLAAEKRKAMSATRKETERRVNRLEKAIFELETQQAEISKQLEDPSSYSDPEAAKEINLKAARVAKYLEEKNYEWEAAAGELSALISD